MVIFLIYTVDGNFFNLPRFDDRVVNSYVRGLKFKSRTSRFWHSIANGSPQLQHLYQ